MTKFLVKPCLTVCLMTTLAGCQLVPTASHPIPVSLTPTAEQLTQRHYNLPNCSELPANKNRHKAKPCLPDKNTKKPTKPLFILQDWL